MAFKEYYKLAKPGIIYGNAVTVVGGFFLAAKGHLHLGTLIAVLVGSSLVMAAACVCNNVLDRDIDALMDRTKERALVKQTIPIKHALFFAGIVGVLGIAVLILFTNLLTAGIGVLGFIFYVIVYGYAKRRTTYGTLIGSISGALPPVAGYCALTNRVDAGAVIVFLILACWQMPHFYAIAMYRLDDYTAAAIPVLPAKRGMSVTKLHILLYTVAFVVATTLLTGFGYAGYTYLGVMLALGVVWIGLGIQGFKAENDTLWARRMFFFSLIMVMVVSLMFAVGPLLK